MMKQDLKILLADTSWNRPSDPHTRSPRSQQSKEMFLGILRNLKLLFLAALIPFLSTTGGERKKVAIRHNLKRTLVGLSVHFVPFVACTTLIVLNLRAYYVGKDVSTTSLQFLAKLLELLTQASISNMALVYLRCLYLDRRPVPFGTLFAGLQITNLNYLWSLEFLGSASSNYFNGKRKFIFVGFVACNLLLAAAIGPSIAVCLIPKRQFSPFRSTSVWKNSSSETPFPRNLSSTNSRCIIGDTLPKCSWEAFPAIFQASRTTGTFQLPLKDDMSYTAEFMSMDPEHVDPMIIGTNRSGIFSCFNNQPMQAARLATTPLISTLAFAASVYLALNLQGHDFWSIRMRYLSGQPVVVAVCQEFEWPSSNTSIVFENPFDCGHSSTSVDANELPKPDKNHDSWAITWFDAPKGAPQISLIAAIVPPVQLLGERITDYLNKTESLDDNILSSNKTFKAEVCSIAAGWADSKVIFTDLQDDVSWFLSSNITKAPEKIVKISRDWASSLIDGWKSVGGRSALDFVIPGILSHAEGGNAALLANVLTHAMSRTMPNNWTSSKDSSDCQKSFTSTEDHFHLKYDVYFDGLAYSPSGLPMVVSLLILLIYCFYVAIYTTIMFIKPLSSSAWDSIAELTALAILSAPTDKLHNTSAGVEMMNTFREPVNIRAVGSDHLEIVFHNDEQKRAADMVQKNKEY